MLLDRTVNSTFTQAERENVRCPSCEHRSFQGRIVCALQVKRDNPGAVYQDILKLLHWQDLTSAVLSPDLTAT